MFLEYYGLREQPFGVTPDPRYLYFSPMHREALASLFYGIETGCGFLTLIAKPGMGKTTLLLHLLERLRKTTRTVFLFQTQCDSREFLRYLLTDLGVDASDQNMAHMHEALNFVLLSNARMGRRFVLVIDEAQNLKKTVLETIRLLSDFESPAAKLMQIVLCGQPQLADKLSHPDLMQLRQRISIIGRLQSFTRVEMMYYIHHRLNVAGHTGAALFSYDAIDKILAHSDGIPRNINNICFNALTLGFAKRQKQIDGATISEVLADLEMDISKSEIMGAGPQTDPFNNGEPNNEATYQDFHLVTRAAWLKGMDSAATNECEESNSISTNVADNNSANISDRIPSANAVVELELEQKRESAEKIVAYLESIRSTSATVSQTAGGVTMYADEAKNLEQSLNSNGSRCANPEHAEVAAAHSGLSSASNTDSAHPDAPVHEEFCGILITHFREKLKGQGLFNAGAHSQDVRPAVPDQPPSRSFRIESIEHPPALPCLKETAPDPATSNSNLNVELVTTQESIPGEPEADVNSHHTKRSDLPNRWKFIDACSRAISGWSRKSSFLPTRVGR